MERSKLDAALEVVMRGTEHLTAQQIAVEVGCSESLVRLARSQARAMGYDVSPKRGRRVNVVAAREKQQAKALRSLRGGALTVYELAEALAVPVTRARVLVRLLVASGAAASDGGATPRYSVTP